MRFVPLLVVPLLLYNAFAFLLFADTETGFREAYMLAVTLPSGVTFTISVAVTIVLFALLLLAVEVVKAARNGAGSMVDQVLAAVVFVAFGAEFLLVRQAATGTFLMLTGIAFVDLVSGLALSLRSPVPVRSPAPLPAAPIPAAPLPPAPPEISPES
jgi:hypothetical protein